MSNKFKLRQLEGFAAAARAGSFVKAASDMAITPPAFSQLIKELETTLGVPLFERTTRHIQLTQAGHRLLQNIGRPLEELQLAYTDMQDVAAGARGEVLFSALHSLAFGPCTFAIARFRKTQPGIEVRMMEDENEDLIERVKTREVDFGIGMFTQFSEGVTFEPVIEDPLVVVVPHDHKFARTKAVRWEQLAGQPLILLSEKSSVRRIVMAELMSANLPLNTAAEVKSMTTVVNMVRVELGIAVLPSIALPSLQLQGLRSSPLAGSNTTRRIGFVRREARQISPAEDAFAQVLRSELRVIPPQKRCVQK